MQPDLTDRKIMELLQADSQLTIKEIASRINLSVTPVHERIRKLEKEGIIDKYVCLLNRRKLGKALVVYCNVTLDKQRKESFEDFNQAIVKMSEVLECSVVSGNFDYMLKVIVEDAEAYNQFYQHKLSALKSVLHISSYFVISEIKYTTGIAVV
ncbi:MULTISPECIES: Lrp/AsnC family transcriptional regulator [Dyadobacter]|uniref:Lrp/AsnC family transcriptional regulator n=2 Tax=Dyadobacter TaxID=120831 RepID=A0A9X1TAT7_9BACT|nr:MULTISPECIES: Lrp/AsnC family transcriptional regulator [Dyadobacter]MCF0041823.1 Lrp/AsnC family transcriptional regulator [Dyadobacter fanqingshengii]MCF0048727.1 Lrp/AsnC family transcriptional regulator [Dyadobacter chenwenxiniae]MCF0062435.1 Lrp/AsnC family transcriptional regulator [Dyadobacter chenwenxiniae]MCF2504951.1 Lrp/AsnC family transcriptional regulator [Dyadobacter fanqingshengii]UON83814.1 Lrp/AsnC family transcriptional regulator [Dyadobacter chenwenxiniae]